jgi:hypothetical protein
MLVAIAQYVALGRLVAARMSQVEWHFVAPTAKFLFLCQVFRS